MKKVLFIGLILFSTIASASPWTQKANIGGVSRWYAVGFSIGTKGYVGTGNFEKDFWEWDQSTNVWTQKADFGGAETSYATGFSIGNKGYIGTGADFSNGPVSVDFWEWDQATNIWVQKADLPGPARGNASGFSIGNNGYIGLGVNGTNIWYTDFWEWDQVGNVWTQKATFPGTAPQAAVNFTIGTKGYVCTGTGDTAIAVSNELYEWDQTSNTWTQKASLPPSAGRYSATGFSIGTKGYVGTGWTVNGDFWAWDQSTNIWTQKSNFGGTGRHAAVGFSIGNKGYLGTGFDMNGLTKDFWEYNPAADTCVVSSFQASASSIYVGDTVYFTNTSAGPSTYTWTINGTVFSTSVNSSYIFGASGTYSIALTVGIGPCANTMSLLVNVTPCITWTKKADLGGFGRTFAVSFSIGSKGYIGTGNGTFSPNTYSDFWEWDQVTNVWTQKANFGGGPRYLAVGFSVGTKGYIGTGFTKASSSSDTTCSDFWEWDQGSNIWTRKANFGGTSRFAAVGFSIGSKGYIGTGRHKQGTAGPFNNCKDFWEYDPLLDSWTQKADFGGVERTYAAGFSISTNGYIGIGTDGAYSLKNDFWEWDQATNTWTQKANFPGVSRPNAMSFATNTKGYFGTGYFNGNLYDDFWEYDPLLDTWMSIVGNFAGGARYGTVGFAIGSRGYIGMGNAPTTGMFKDFWEYNPCTGAPTEVEPVNTDQHNNLQIYPNPSSGLFRVEKINGGILSLSIYNVFGERISIVQGSSSLVIDISSQPSGIYFLQIKTSNGVEIRKIVKE